MGIRLVIGNSMKKINSVTEMLKQLSPKHVSMVNAIASCLNFDAEIQLVHNDVPFVASTTGAMIHNCHLCSFDMSTVIPLEAISKLECRRIGKLDTPIITVWLKQEPQ